MNRLEIDQSYIDGLAAREHGLGQTEDLDVDPEHRRDRLPVDDTASHLTTESTVKRYDHVRLWDWVDGVVIGPARHADFFLVHVPEMALYMGDVWTVESTAITDRAPLDPNEVAMPVMLSELTP